jgi:cytochrome c556
MRHGLRIWLGGVALLAVAGVAATRDSDYAGWMKTVGDTIARLRKNINSAQTEAIAADSQILEQQFKQVEAFWQQRDAADAVRFAREARAAAASIAREAAAGNLEQVRDELLNLSSTCGSCHNVHRQKLPSGGYKIF